MCVQRGVGMSERGMGRRTAFHTQTHVHTCANTYICVHVCACTPAHTHTHLRETRGFESRRVSDKWILG